MHFDSPCIDALKLQHNQITNQLERKSSQSEAVSKVWEELKLKIEEKIQALYKEIDVVLYNGTHKLDNKINKMRYNFKTKQRRLYV